MIVLPRLRRVVLGPLDLRVAPLVSTWVKAFYSTRWKGFYDVEGLCIFPGRCGSLVAGHGNRALGFFASGFNCAESVFLVLNDRLSKRGKRCTCAVPCVATGFGGGIGRSGATCGALSGVVLAIGLAINHDKAADVEKKYKVYDLVSKVVTDFERKFGSSLCATLTGFNLREKEERLRYRSQRVQDKMCSKFVTWCTDYGAHLIDNLREGKKVSRS